MVQIGSLALSLRHIEIFHAVYVNGSVTAAATALHVSQPSVSSVLKHAESRLGFALFRRVNGRLMPSEEAHMLFKEVDEVHRRIESLHTTARNLRGRGQGHIRLAVPPALGFSIASIAVARFCAKFPNVTFEVQTRNNEDMPQALCERESDLAVSYVVPQHPRLSSSQIGTGELVVLFRKGALKTSSPRVGLEVLAGRDVIGLTGGKPLGDLFTAEVKAKAPAFRTRVTVQTCYVAAALARSGVGIAVVDEFTARSCLIPEIDYRHLEPKVCFGIYSVFLLDRPPAGNILRFQELLKTVVAEK
jgi:DNA-binding transcriptional LysR family regulator